VLPVDEGFIGREPERSALGSLAARARAGDGSIVLLVGEAGVGKSTLARAVLADSGLDVVHGFGSQAGAAAYGPIVEALRGLLESRTAGDAIEPGLAPHLAVLLPARSLPSRAWHTNS
jgi:AAA ATPase domain